MVIHSPSPNRSPLILCLSLGMSSSQLLKKYPSVNSYFLANSPVLTTTLFASLVPGTVDDVTASAVNYHTITVTWRDPLKPNGKILQYGVTYNTSGGTPFTVFVPADKREVTLDDLTPNTTYFIFVTASTSKGYGKRGTIVNASTRK